MTAAPSLWEQVQPNEQGLVPCVAQDLRTRAVLMVAWVSKEALEATLESGLATYFSRSRGELWQKGSTSGHSQRIVHIRLDCDGDTLIYLVEAGLPACHTGTDTCFHWRRVGPTWVKDPVQLQPAGETEQILEALDTVLDARLLPAAVAEKPSYTRALLEGGLPKQSAKIREETEELLAALAGEADDRVVNEAADVLYHLAVALKARKLSFKSVLGELERRLGTSGLEEKARRKPKHQG